jgi:hypothetical protein
MRSLHGAQDLDPALYKFCTKISNKQFFFTKIALQPFFMNYKLTYLYFYVSHNEVPILAQTILYPRIQIRAHTSGSEPTKKVRIRTRYLSAGTVQ